MEDASPTVQDVRHIWGLYCRAGGSYTLQFLLGDQPTIHVSQIFEFLFNWLIFFFLKEKIQGF